LYIDEIDWNLHQQEYCDFPDRNNSSSEEEHTRSYYKRGARGDTEVVEEIFLEWQLESIGNTLITDRSAPYTKNMSVPTGWPDNSKNTSSDAPDWKNQTCSIKSTKDNLQIRQIAD